MSILSDSEIRDRCVMPAQKLDEDKYNRLLHAPEAKPAVLRDYIDEMQDMIDRSNRIRLESMVDWTAEEKAAYKPMIFPFVDHQVRAEREELDSAPFSLDKKVVSYGLSSYGYDLRVGRKWKIFSNALASVIDPKDFDSKSFVDFEGDVCIVPPNSFVLAHSHERICMPRDVTGVVLAKSTYARTGLACLATPLEAGWEGYVTLEFANTTPLPIKIYSMEGACQVLFFKGSKPPMVSYADRGGKYQNQAAEPVIPKV
jgi:dCTP deaminase